MCLEDMFRQLLAVAIICILSEVAYTATDLYYRLNTPIVPSAYRLLITPYFDIGGERAFTFDGEVTVQFTTTANTNQIKFHSEDLLFTVENITVTNINTSVNLVLNDSNPLEFDTEYTFAYINLLTDLVPNVQYSLTISYTGPLREDLSGFYRNYYLENGVKKWLGATQMESTDARKAFPCFDEPSLKATFTIHIDRPENYSNSLSNMKMQSSQSLGNGYIRETFYPTPRMPTYLVAFVVSEFDFGEYRNGTREFGVFTRPEAKNQTGYAFDFGTKVVDELGTFFDIDYYSTNQNIKLDHVSIPDFSTGAMENWGLVIYREALLLYDQAMSGPYYRYSIAQLLAHETTHMWFGNLVTCHWWSDTWLNEGFANYFQDYITALIEPELGSANLLVTSSVYTAYDSDSSRTSNPISNININSPEEIGDNFGAITYQKGGSIIRMIHHLIGDEAFKLGLQTYLKNNSFGSGYPEFLYAGLDAGVSIHKSLSSYPNATVADIMGSWISQAGHPVLQVNIDYSTGAVTLSQKRFYLDAAQASTEIYKIPITYTTGVSPDFNNTKPVFIMDEKTHEFTIANISQAHSWVIFNIQETGFYRVNYDENAWQIIGAALKGSDHDTIHHLNRAKIVNDLFALVYADEINFSILHDVLGFLSKEDEYSVWLAAVKGFSKLRNSYLGNTETLPEVEAYILKLLDLGVSKFGYEVNVTTDSFEDLRNRQQLLELACKLGHSGCVQYAVAAFKALKDSGTEVSPSLRSVVYSTGIRYGTGDDYDFMWNRMVNSNLANEVSVIIEALGHTSVEEKLGSYLVSMTVENSPIRTQDITVPLTTVLSNYNNLQLVMDTVKQDYVSWNDIYDDLDTPLSAIAASLHTKSDFNEFEAFLENCTVCTNETKAVARTVLEASKANTAWAEKHTSAILSSLRSYSDTVLPSLLMIVLVLAYCISV